jgi:hypothetical protein
MAAAGERSRKHLEAEEISARKHLEAEEIYRK